MIGASRGNTKRFHRITFFNYPDVGPNSDDTGMNSIGYMCNSGQEIWYDGYWGTWESTYHACNGGFDGLKVKFIKQVNTCAF